MMARWLGLVGGMTALTAGAGADVAMEWAPLPPLPLARGGHAAACLDGRLVLLGGTNWTDGQKQWLARVDAYSPADGAWEAGAELPRPLAYAATAARGRKLWLVGGTDGTATLRTVRTAGWRREGLAVAEEEPLPKPRVFACAEFLGPALYVIGGAEDHGDLGTARPTLFARLSTQRDAPWRQGPDLPARPRALMASAALWGGIYIFGGCYLDEQGAVRNLRQTWRYDPRSDTWRRCADCPYSARAWEAVALDDRYALICGGYVATPEEAAGKGPEFGFTDQVLMYDAVTDHFEVIGRQHIPAVSSAPVLWGRALYVTGGEHRMRARTDRAAVGLIRGTPGRD